MIDEKFEDFEDFNIGCTIGKHVPDLKTLQYLTCRDTYYVRCFACDNDYQVDSNFRLYLKKLNVKSGEDLILYMAQRSC